MCWMIFGSTSSHVAPIYFVLSYLSCQLTLSANTASSFAPVVRIEGTSTTVPGGTGTLIGDSQSGSLLRMVFVETDHTLERIGTLTTIGFGNLSSPAVDLSVSSASNVQELFYGANGTTDISMIGLTIDLNTLTGAQQSYLLSITPVPVATMPASPFVFQAYTYGQDGSSFTSYGTQNTFSNTVDTITSFSGSYTTDSHGTPLNYTETVAEWRLHSPPIVPNEGTATSGGSGSPLILNGTMVGFQVNGSTTVGATNMGVSFAAADVTWIDHNTAQLLAQVPEPTISYLVLTGLIAWLLFCRKAVPRSP